MSITREFCKWDGHTHSPFCRHGDKAALSVYIEKAVMLGFERYTITEHPPLPKAWLGDSGLMNTLAMAEDELSAYLQMVIEAKRKYESLLDVRVGLELDYLHGRESYTFDIVDRCDGLLEEAIVSIHFLPGKGGMRCVDLSPFDFQDGLIHYYGDFRRVIDAYFDHVELAISLAGRLPIPTRIGHVNLIQKFRSVLPALDEAQIDERMARLLPLLRKYRVGVDANVAGLRKKTCGLPYVPEWFLQGCRSEGISVTYGSDAHRPEDVGVSWEWFFQAMGGGVADACD